MPSLGLKASSLQRYLKKSSAVTIAVVAIAALAGVRHGVAEPTLADSGRLKATSGVSQIEGSAGGGLVPWAVIAGYGTADAIGGSAHGTEIRTNNYNLWATGAAIGLFNRGELSFTHQEFDTQAAGRRLGLGAGYAFHQDVVGAKIRVVGDVVYGPAWLPQIALGAQYKVNDRKAILHAIGAKSDHGVDFYASATKLWLQESLVLNATIRLTRANETGLLGFGGDRHDAYRPEFETSIAAMLSPSVALGAEYRTKPSNLRLSRESDWYDVFIAWFPTKHISGSLAYVNLGTIAGRKNQNGIQLSAQVGF